MNVAWRLNGAKKMLLQRGLEPGGRVQQLFSHALAKEMDPYVPMQDGHLKNDKQIGANSVTYPGPYARYQYRGKVMVNAKTGKGPMNIPGVGLRYQKGTRLKVTLRSLTYRDAPIRGPFWDKRCWRDKKDKIVAQVAAAAGGEPGR